MQRKQKGQERVVPTKLKLKGKPINIRKIVKNAKREHPESEPPVDPEPVPVPKNPKEEDKDEIEIQPIEEGTGKIMTSLATVHGKDTVFLQELEPGDKLIIHNPQTKEEEERQINMVLSNKSLGIKEPFSRDLSSFTEFKYQKKPIVRPKEKPIDELVEEKLAKFAKTEDPTKKKTVVEYRANAGPWTYKKVTEEVEGELSREQLLDIRVKKSRDKFCWY